jgi:uncharacterized protein YlaI
MPIYEYACDDCGDRCKRKNRPTKKRVGRYEPFVRNER